MGRRSLSQKGRDFWARKEERKNSRQAQFTVPSVVYKQPLVCWPKWYCYLRSQCHTYTLDLNSFTWSTAPQRLYMWGYLKKTATENKKDICAFMWSLYADLCGCKWQGVYMCESISVTQACRGLTWWVAFRITTALTSLLFPCIWREKLTTGQAGKL